MEKSKVEKIRASMGDGKRSEFDSYVLTARTDSDIWRWLQNDGHTVSLGAVSSWRRLAMPDGKVAKELKASAADYEGLEAIASLSTLEGSALKLVEHITTAFSQCDGEPDLNTMKLLAMIPGLMREARTAAKERQMLKYARDRAALEIAGAQRLADIIRRTFEDTPMEEPIKEALRGGLMQVEDEAEERH